MTIHERVAELKRLSTETGKPRIDLLREKVGKFSSGPWGSMHDAEIKALEKAQKKTAAIKALKKAVKKGSIT